MYYPDLSPYSYANSGFVQKLKTRYGFGYDTQFLNVGWLDAAFPYEKGAIDDIFLQKLFRRMRDQNSTIMYRGFHECPFCVDDTFREPNHSMTFTILDGEKYHLGSVDFFVYDNRSTVFIAPNLIYHYITVHQYRPPDAFCEAILALP